MKELLDNLYWFLDDHPTLAYILIVVTIIMAITFFGIGLDLYLYNDGYCWYCNKGQYEFLDVERGNYYYKCTKCDYVTDFFLPIERYK